MGLAGGSPAQPSPRSLQSRCIHRPGPALWGPSTHLLRPPHAACKYLKAITSPGLSRLRAEQPSPFFSLLPQRSSEPFCSRFSSPHVSGLGSPRTRAHRMVPWPWLCAGLRGPRGKGGATPASLGASGSVGPAPAAGDKITFKCSCLHGCTWNSTLLFLMSFDL